MKESRHTEWKETWRDEFLKWICGFANAEVGVLHIGGIGRSQWSVLVPPQCATVRSRLTSSTATRHTIGSDGVQRDTASTSDQAPSDSVVRRVEDGEPPRSSDGGTSTLSDDKGAVVGLPNAAQLLEEIPNKVRDILGIMVEVNLRV